MRLVYMAHPVRPQEGETVASNLDRARRWLAWLIGRDPTIAYIAPWIPECEIFDDSDEAQRASSLARAVAVAARCDEIVLVGGRLSDGMRAEAIAAHEAGRYAHDLTYLGPEPPT